MAALPLCWRCSLPCCWAITLGDRAWNTAPTASASSLLSRTCMFSSLLCWEIDATSVLFGSAFCSQRLGARGLFRTLRIRVSGRSPPMCLARKRRVATPPHPDNFTTYLAAQGECRAQKILQHTLPGSLSTGKDAILWRQRQTVPLFLQLRASLLLLSWLLLRSLRSPSTQLTPLSLSASLARGSGSRDYPLRSEFLDLLPTTLPPRDIHCTSESQSPSSGLLCLRWLSMWLLKLRTNAVLYHVATVTVVTAGHSPIPERSPPRS